MFVSGEDCLFVNLVSVDCMAGAFFVCAANFSDQRKFGIELTEFGSWNSVAVDIFKNGTS